MTNTNKKEAMDYNLINISRKLVTKQSIIHICNLNFVNYFRRIEK